MDFWIKEKRLSQAIRSTWLKHVKIKHMFETRWKPAQTRYNTVPLLQIKFLQIMESHLEVTNRDILTTECKKRVLQKQEKLRKSAACSETRLKFYKVQATLLHLPWKTRRINKMARGSFSRWFSNSGRIPVFTDQPVMDMILLEWKVMTCSQLGLLAD